jgi:hypothetical protein
MNKKEKDQLLSNYSYYYQAYKNNIVEKEMVRVAKNMLSGLISTKDIIQIENNIDWQEYPVILGRFNMLAETISYCMPEYIFEYNINSLELIKDEIPFNAESEKQANAITELCNDLINRIQYKSEIA